MQFQKQISAGSNKKQVISQEFFPAHLFASRGRFCFNFFQSLQYLLLGFTSIHDQNQAASF